jgi:succinate dehydrogenase / fumarate reductase iron-sulfur subunit
MIAQQMDKEGFGACTNTGDCEAVCPKEIKMNNISFMNKSFIKSFFSKDK